MVPELTFISFGHALGGGEGVETVSPYQSNRDHFMRALVRTKREPKQGLPAGDTHGKTDPSVAGCGTVGTSPEGNMGCHSILRRCCTQKSVAA